MVSYVRGRTRAMSDEELVALYASGVSSAEVAIRANTDASTVLYLAKKAGVPIRPRGPRARHVTLPLDDAEIIRLYRSGLSGPTIADRCNTSASTIYNVLRRNQVELRPSAANLRAALGRKGRSG